MAHFLNADLEILSSQPLDSFCEEIGDRANLLHCGEGRNSPYLAVYEIDDDQDNKQPEVLILRFCELIESLSQTSLRLWSDATRRVIDLGYEADNNGAPQAMDLEPESLARMAALNISLAFTIYPSDAPSVIKR